MIDARPLRSNRSGFTLRELTIALAIGGTVMMTAVSMLHQAFDWSTIARHRRMDDQTFFSLSRQLRTDVHVAREATVGNQSETTGNSLKLTTDVGNVVVYTIGEGFITRRETHDDEDIRHERYRWKRPRTVSLDRSESDDQIQLNIKSVTPFAGSEVPLWRSFRVSIGLRLRHQDGDIES